MQSITTPYQLKVVAKLRKINKTDNIAANRRKSWNKHLAQVFIYLVYLIYIARHSPKINITDVNYQNG